MDTPTARRVIIGSLLVSGTVSAIRAVADDDDDTKASPSILVGGLFASAGLSLLAGPAPDVAAGLAAIIVITSLLPRRTGSAVWEFAGRIAQRDEQARLAREYPGVGSIGALISGDWSDLLTAQAPTPRLVGNPSPDYLGAPTDTDGWQAGGITTVRGRKASPVLHARLWPMVDAAAAQGVTLEPGSMFRTRAEQIALRVSNGCPDIDQSPASTCRIPTAIPGTSMHEKGLAVDFRNLSDAGYAWLKANAASYSLYNLPGERWHWSTTGK